MRNEVFWVCLFLMGLAALAILVHGCADYEAHAVKDEPTFEEVQSIFAGCTCHTKGTQPLLTADGLINVEHRCGTLVAPGNAANSVCSCVRCGAETSAWSRCRRVVNRCRRTTCN